VSIFRLDYPQEQTSSRHFSTPEKCRYCCKSPKLPGANFPAVKKSTDDRRSMWPQSRYRGRQRVFLRTMRSPHIYTEVACTAKRNFDRECKKTFATKSARKRHMHRSKQHYYSITSSARAIASPSDEAGHRRVHVPCPGGQREHRVDWAFE
jgi:hypothetical protein